MYVCILPMHRLMVAVVLEVLDYTTDVVVFKIVASDGQKCDQTASLVVP